VRYFDFGNGPSWELKDAQPLDDDAAIKAFLTGLPVQVIFVNPHDGEMWSGRAYITEIITGPEPIMMQILGDGGCYPVKKEEML